MIEATNTGGAQRELTPSGNHIARCYEMIHVGTNKELLPTGEKIMNKVRITWELPGELRVFDEAKGEQPMVISKEYTLSMHEKSNLRKDLESWRGKGFTEDEAKAFDITKLLGVACLVNVIHVIAKSNGNTYANISSITTLIKGMECPAQINPTFEFNYTDKFDPQIVESFPEFIKNKIKTSSEYKDRLDSLQNEHYNNDAPPVEEVDDLPF